MKSRESKEILDFFSLKAPIRLPKIKRQINHRASPNTSFSRVKPLLTIPLCRISVQSVEDEMYRNSFLCFLFQGQFLLLKKKNPSEWTWSFSNTLTFCYTDRGSEAHRKSQHPLGGEGVDNVTTLNVSVISIPVLVISAGKLGVLLAVWDSPERRVVVETRVEDLIHYFRRLLSADVPHGQDGAEGAASDALLSGAGEGKQNLEIRIWNQLVLKLDSYSCDYLMMLLEAKVEPGSFILKGAVSTQVSCPDLK